MQERHHYTLLRNCCAAGSCCLPVKNSVQRKKPERKRTAEQRKKPVPRRKLQRKRMLERKTMRVQKRKLLRKTRLELMRKTVFDEYNSNLNYQQVLLQYRMHHSRMPLRYPNNHSGFHIRIQPDILAETKMPVWYRNNNPRS